VTRSDEQLVAAWQTAGDRAALEELATRHLATVRRMIHSMTLDDGRADDLAQEVFLRAFRSLGSFQGRARFTTWLYRIAMNAPISGHASLPPDAVSRTEPPATRAERVERAGAVSRALADLPPKLRAAIVLVSIEEMDPAEAARIEGCTRATIYWRLHEARKRLAAALREHVEP
jgi:RNA polymerase sigma-70 factor (ECF subfamily)